MAISETMLTDKQTLKQQRLHILGGVIAHTN